MYLRYKKFSKLDMGIVAEEHKWAFFQDLLPLEQNMVCGDAIGNVKEHPFFFHVTDERPIR